VHTPGAVSVVPAAHAPSATQLDWFAVVVLVPAAHGLHCRSVDAVPAALTNFPGSHVVHGAQLVAFAVARKVPFAHAAHARSVVADGAFDTKVPGSHVRHGTHGVLGLWSASHVPSAHVVAGAPLSGTPPPSGAGVVVVWACPAKPSLKCVTCAVSACPLTLVVRISIPFSLLDQMIRSSARTPGVIGISTVTGRLKTSPSGENTYTGECATYPRGAATPLGVVIAICTSRSSAPAGTTRRAPVGPAATVPPLGPIDLAACGPPSA
jgi:hypothetical protein